jgi:hypothetical protein
MHVHAPGVLDPLTGMEPATEVRIEHANHELPLTGSQARLHGGDDGEQRLGVELHDRRGPGYLNLFHAFGPPPSVSPARAAELSIMIGVLIGCFAILRKTSNSGARDRGST